MRAHSNDDQLPAWRRYMRLLRENPRADVEEELAFHIEAAAAELIARGVPAEDARERARQSFGNVDEITATLQRLTEQRVRTVERRAWREMIRQDIAFGLRQLRRTPAFTAVAVLTLALGIGANSAIFSVVYSVLLRALPYAHSDRILSIWERDGASSNAVTLGNFATWRDEAKSFEALGAEWGQGELTLTGYGEPSPVPVVRRTADAWRAEYIAPALGRYFTESEAREGACNYVVLSYALWKNKFGGDRSIVGRNITLNAQPYTVVGVAPPDYIAAPPAERVWLPLVLTASARRSHSDHELDVVGLVRPGVSNADALRELQSIDRRLAKEFRHGGFDGGIDAQPPGARDLGDARLALYTLLAAVTLVLLIACGNIANLLIARGAVRRPEIAIRRALGASRRRVIGQLLIESALLGIAGGAMGTAVAAGGIRFLAASPVAIPHLRDATLNVPVLAFTACLSIVCALVFGLMPALRASHADAQTTLRDGGRGTAGSARDRARTFLVAGEICLAEVLLVSAGLLIRSVMLVQAVPPGFAAKNLVAMTISLPTARYPDDARREAKFQQIESAMAAVPGVEGVGRSLMAPIYGSGLNCNAFREGSSPDAAVGAANANIRSADPTYFRTLGVPLLRGRNFTSGDGANGPPVVIINRGLAEKLFGDADPIGRRVANCQSMPATAGGAPVPVWREVVGVIGDIRASGLERAAPDEFYVPAAQFVNPRTNFVVRSTLPPERLVPSLRRAVAGVDPLVPLIDVKTIEQAIAEHLAVPRFDMWLLVLLGATGLALAVVGVYGVIAYFVAARTREIGVRMALGATPGSVRQLVVRQGLGVAAAGVGAGTALSLFTAGLLRHQLYGITARDPLTFVAVAALLLAVALAASYLPARRATRIDPVDALRDA